MSSETLRRAASLMRARATDRAVPESPWFVEDDGGDYNVLAVDPGCPIPFDVARNVPAGRAEDDHSPVAEHIASWHPDVAIAVADSLDAAGADLWAYGPLHCEDGCTECDDALWMPPVRRALTVARAYLGETS